MLKKYNLQFASNCCGFSFRHAVYRIQKKLFIPSPYSGKFSQGTHSSLESMFFLLLLFLFLLFFIYKNLLPQKLASAFGVIWNSGGIFKYFERYVFLDISAR